MSIDKIRYGSSFTSRAAAAGLDGATRRQAVAEMEAAWQRAEAAHGSTSDCVAAINAVLLPYIREIDSRNKAAINV